MMTSVHVHVLGLFLWPHEQQSLLFQGMRPPHLQQVEVENLSS
jgi:hypothetical protein